MESFRKTIRLHRDARSEIEESVNFYRQRGGPHLSDRFKQRLGEAFEAIVETRKNSDLIRKVRRFIGVALSNFPSRFFIS
jgi:plasmid stabilization system protein ParE